MSTHAEKIKTDMDRVLSYDAPAPIRTTIEPGALPVDVVRDPQPGRPRAVSILRSDGRTEPCHTILDVMMKPTVLIRQAGGGSSVSGRRNEAKPKRA